VVCLTVFSRSEHRQGRLCVKPVGLWHVCKMMVKDGFIVVCQTLGCTISPQEALEGPGLVRCPRLFKEGELLKPLLPKRNDTFWLIADQSHGGVVVLRCSFVIS